MREKVRAGLLCIFPHLAARLRSADDAERIEAELQLEYMVTRDFDRLLPYMLLMEPFLRMYFSVLSSLDTTDVVQVKKVLDDMADRDTGAFFYGDVAFLKIANNESDEHGDWMLGVVGDGIRRVGAELYSRLRGGDEFGLYHSSVNVCAAALERMSRELSEHRVASNLPVSIDFGYASHKEVAETYLRLLAEGWGPSNRPAYKVFFDIALKMAKVRCAVQKIYNRALLLLYMFQDPLMGDPLDPESEYIKQEKELSRGGNFVYPEPSWLEVPEDRLGDFLRMKALAKLVPDPNLSHFDRVVVEVAESIYLDPL